jgi:hypothetical protein
MTTLIKTVETKNGKKYYKFSQRQHRLFPMKKIEAELFLTYINYENKTTRYI